MSETPSAGDHSSLWQLSGRHHISAACGRHSLLQRIRICDVTVALYFFSYLNTLPTDIVEDTQIRGPKLGVMDFSDAALHAPR